MDYYTKITKATHKILQVSLYSRGYKVHKFDVFGVFDDYRKIQIFLNTHTYKTCSYYKQEIIICILKRVKLKSYMYQSVTN